MTGTIRQWRGVIDEYRDRLPLGENAPVIGIGEGGTPLIPSLWLSRLTGCDVRLKIEGANPTGSFKDRGMTVAISAAADAGAQAVVCASTGNTSASMTAYAARAGLTPIVVIPHGRIAVGKLAQTIVHGARLVPVRGNFDECLMVSRSLADDFPVSLVNSVNPMRLHGQKTAAFEIVDALGAAPDVHVLPVGNAGNITAYWMGYREYRNDGMAAHTPQMWGFQAAGSAPIVGGAAVPDPDTVASAIRIGNPASWQLAEAARDESAGRIATVSDQSILDAQRMLATRDGVFVEPASAAGAAGLAAAAHELPRGSTIVVTVTGNGLKDTDTAISGITLDTDPIRADAGEAARVAGLV